MRLPDQRHPYQPLSGAVGNVNSPASPVMQDQHWEDTKQTDLPPTLQSPLQLCEPAVRRESSSLTSRCVLSLQVMLGFGRVSSLFVNVTLAKNAHKKQHEPSLYGKQGLYDT